ncbi:MAG: cation:proton antiporter [Candidatus Omnitrophota bacterium]
MKHFFKSLFLFIAFNTVSFCYASETQDPAHAGIIERMDLLVLQVGIILFAAWLGGKVFKKLKLPTVLGEILAGTIIGPYLLGSVPMPGFPGGLFPLQQTFPISPELYGFTTVASIILLFLVGIETDIETFFKFSFAGSIIGIGGVLISFIFGDILGILFSNIVLQTPMSFMDPVPLFLGVISTATSVGITAHILSERRKLDSPEGVTILSGAVIDDVLGIIVLAVVVGIIKSGRVDWGNIFAISSRALAIWLGFTTLGLIFSKQISNFLKRFKDKTTMSILSLALALLLAGIFERSGLAMIIGAYIMGLSLSNTDISYIIQDNLATIKKFLVPVFFCVMGMLVNVNAMTSLPVIIFGLVYTLLAVLGKILGCSVPALFLNFNLRGALRVGVGMIPRGEVALIIAGIGLSLGVLQNEAFNIAIIMTFLTTLITPPLLVRLLGDNRSVLRKENLMKAEHKEIVYSMPNDDTSEFILSKVVLAFENEGFYVTLLALHDQVYQIRKNQTFIILKYYPDKLVFDISADDEAFVHTVFYEVIAEWEKIMKQLQSLTDTNAIGKKIFGTETTKNAGVNTHKFQISVNALEVNLNGINKEVIINELVDLLIKSGQVKFSDRDIVLKDVFDREMTMSTGMQNGIALPHAKSSAVSKIVCAVGLKKDGVDFDSLDKQPSKIFILTIAPKEYPQSYLQFMANVTSFFMSDENRERTLAAKNNNELFRVLSL